MKTLRDKITFILLAAFYLLVSGRFYLKRPLYAVQETLLHILSVAPFTLGLTIVAVALFRKLTGDQLPWDRVVRLFFMFSIVLEFFFGLHDYLSRSGLNG